MDDITRRLEAVIFISPRPVATDELAAACEASGERVAAGLAALTAEYAGRRHGIELAEVAGGYAFRVAPDCEAPVERFAGARRPDDLSPALLETLAVVAYLQPTTRAEVAQIRGVSSEWALTSARRARSRRGARPRRHAWCADPLRHERALSAALRAAQPRRSRRPRVVRALRRRSRRAARAPAVERREETPVSDEHTERDDERADEDQGEPRRPPAGGARRCARREGQARRRGRRARAPGRTARRARPRRAAQRHDAGRLPGALRSRVATALRRADPRGQGDDRRHAS